MGRKQRKLAAPATRSGGEGSALVSAVVELPKPKITPPPIPVGGSFLELAMGGAVPASAPPPPPPPPPPKVGLCGHAAVAAYEPPRADPYTLSEWRALLDDARAGDDRARRHVERLIADPYFDPNKLPSRVNGKLQRPDPPAWHGPLPFAKCDLGGLRHVQRGPTEAEWAQMRADYQASRRARTEANPRQRRNHFGEE